MQFFVDENIPLITVNSLKQSGYDVLDIRGTEKEGITDNAIWEIVKNERRLLITTDKGFAVHRYESHPGIIIVCLKKPNENKIHNKIIKILDKYSSEDLENALIVVRDEVQSFWKSHL
jgi:predicted nuclease of predicted toxin-antitoxin system